MQARDRGTVLRPPRIHRPDLIRGGAVSSALELEREIYFARISHHHGISGWNLEGIGDILQPNLDETKRLPQPDRDRPLDEVIEDFGRRLRPGGPDD